MISTAHDNFVVDSNYISQQNQEIACSNYWNKWDYNLLYKLPDARNTAVRRCVSENVHIVDNGLIGFMDFNQFEGIYKNNRNSNYNLCNNNINNNYNSKLLNMYATGADNMSRDNHYISHTPQVYAHNNYVQDPNCVYRNVSQPIISTSGGRIVRQISSCPTPYFYYSNIPANAPILANNNLYTNNNAYTGGNVSINPQNTSVYTNPNLNSVYTNITDTSINNNNTIGNPYTNNNTVTYNANNTYPQQIITHTPQQNGSYYNGSVVRQQPTFTTYTYPKPVVGNSNCVIPQKIYSQYQCPVPATPSNAYTQANMYTYTSPNTASLTPVVRSVSGTSSCVYSNKYPHTYAYTSSSGLADQFKAAGINRLNSCKYKSYNDGRIPSNIKDMNDDDVWRLHDELSKNKDFTVYERKYTTSGDASHLYVNAEPVC